jgi:hypothetical protein
MKRQAAAAAPDYTPSAALTADDDSQGFTMFEQRWSSELSTMRNQASHEGDGRFYYTGMAQAFLLDRLMPGWKSQLMDEGEYLENLLRKAVNRNEFAGAQGNAIGQSASQPALDEIDLFVEA